MHLFVDTVLLDGRCSFAVTRRVALLGAGALAVGRRRQAAVGCRRRKDAGLRMAQLGVNDQRAAAFAVDGHALARMLCFDRAAADERFGARVNDRHKRHGKGVHKQNGQRESALALPLASFSGPPSDHEVVPSVIRCLLLPPIPDFCSPRQLD